MASSQGKRVTFPKVLPRDFDKQVRLCAECRTRQKSREESCKSAKTSPPSRKEETEAQGGCIICMKVTFQGTGVA